MAERLYMTHFNRGDPGCPLCGQYVIWRKVGEHKYCPCDKIPVLCMWNPDSPLRVVYRGEIISGVNILREDNAADFVNKPRFYALQPHVFTCPEIRHNTSKTRGR